MKRSVFSLVLVIILVVFAAGNAAAQTFMFKNIPTDVSQFGLRFLRPDFEGESSLSTFSGVYDITLSLAVNEKWSIDAAFPYTRLASDENDFSESYMGNVYVGLQHISRNGNGSSIWSFGVYMPMGDDDLTHLIFGSLTNQEDMFKFWPNAWTLYGNFAYFNINKGGARLGLELGPDLLISTGGNSDDPEFFMHYGLTAGYQGKNIAAITEIVGLAILTEDPDEGGDRFMHSINFGLSYVSEHFLPGVFYKIYLEEENRELVDGVLGVNIEVIL